MEPIASHEHNWQTSPLLAYVATKWDGINSRAVRLQICAECGLLRANPTMAGHTTYDEYEDALEAKGEAR